MPPTSDPDAAAEASACAAARECKDLPDALTELYARVDRDIRRLAPPCERCGRCCRFDQAAHRLFASVGEWAMLSQQCGAIDAAENRCPYQAGNACMARDGRTLACRTYFCHAATRLALRDIYEQYHAQIRRLHATHSVPYHYLDLTAARLPRNRFFCSNPPTSCR